MLRCALAAALAASAAAAVIELDPRVESHQETITSNLNDCSFDVILDVRQQYYYQNWGIRGAEWINSVDWNQLVDGMVNGRIRKVAFYCWVAPWESEPVSLWFDQHFGHLGVETYDMKGLTYLDDIPGFCPYIHGTPELFQQMSPQCADATAHTCPTETSSEPVAPTEEQLAAARSSPVSLDTPELAPVRMSPDEIRQGIATALSEYYGRPVEIDLSNLPGAPRQDAADSVSLTDETIQPLVPVHRDTSHEGFYVLSYADAPEELVVVDGTIQTAEPVGRAPTTSKNQGTSRANATEEGSTNVENIWIVFAVVCGAVALAAVAAGAWSVTKSPEREQQTRTVEKHEKEGVETEPQFTTENALAEVQVEAVKPTADEA